MSLFPVSTEKQKDLEDRMKALGLREVDLVEDFIRGSGAGGQKINKTSSMVVLKHIPSNMMVRCQESRSQALNRFLARKSLVIKLETLRLGKESKEEQEREKIRRQKRRRSRRAKNKMLDDKKHHAEKKKMRGSVNTF